MVNLAAIQERGDVTTNYQIFPNDRLIVGRNEVEKQTAKLVRLARPIQSVEASVQNVANMLLAVKAVDPARSEEVVRKLVDFWAKQVSRGGDLKFDEADIRELLLQNLKPAATLKK